MVRTTPHAHFETVLNNGAGEDCMMKNIINFTTVFSYLRNSSGGSQIHILMTDTESTQ